MFAFRHGSLHAESVPLEAIAREFGTPCYVYSRAMVDAAMNDLIRPALYEAWHDIVPVRNNGGPKAVYDVVGPVCESADFLGKERELAVREGDLLPVISAGGYATCMSSSYNSRPRAAEVMADGTRTHLVRERERPEALFALEHVLR